MKAFSLVNIIILQTSENKLTYQTKLRVCVLGAHLEYFCHPSFVNSVKLFRYYLTLPFSLEKIFCKMIFHQIKIKQINNYNSSVSYNRIL